jgi:glycosyltransferase involved in cell wall biosynthesis
MDLWTIIAGIFSGISALAFFKATRDLQSYRAIEDFEPAGDLPSLSIIVTARNEASGIEACIESLLAQDYPRFDLTIVNDRSTDQTGPLLETLSERKPRLNLIEIKTLPDGWLGKTHACHQAVQSVQGDWILFCDADIMFSESILKRALSYATQHQLDHLTILPNYRAPSFFLDILNSVTSNILLASTRAAAIARLNRGDGHAKDKTRGRVLGIGAFNLVRKSKWVETPGFEEIKGEVLDDMGVAWLMKQAQAKRDWLWSKSQLSVVWYPSISAMFHGLKKSFWAGARYRPFALFIQAIGLLALAVSPVTCVLFVQNDVIRGLGLVALLIQTWLGIRRSHLGYQGLARTLLGPLGQVCIAAMMILTAIQGSISRKLNWRGTSYSFVMLKEAQVVWTRRK